MRSDTGNNETGERRRRKIQLPGLGGIAKGVAGLWDKVTEDHPEPLPVDKVRNMCVVSCVVCLLIDICSTNQSLTQEPSFTMVCLVLCDLLLPKSVPDPRAAASSAREAGARASAVLADE